MDKNLLTSETVSFPLTGGACALPALGIIRAQGADAASFLHGQLSNDLNRLDTAHARLAAYCTPQGRMLASLVCARASADELWLACSADVLPPTLKRLSMFVLRAKARLSDASADLMAIGLSGSTAATWLGDQAPQAAWDKIDLASGMVIALPEAVMNGNKITRWLWLGVRAEGEALLALLPALAPTQWAELEVRSGVAPVVAATAGQFVPQMLNYELVGGVDFKKGCYPGQEIVARSQYLGKLKRRTFLVAGPAEMVPGQEVFSSNDPAQPSGVIAVAAVSGVGAGTGHVALAELKVAAVTSGTLHLGQADGPVLQVGTLPYALPLEAASA